MRAYSFEGNTQPSLELTSLQEIIQAANTVPTITISLHTHTMLIFAYGAAVILR
jgi:hypothetical protein